MTTSESDRRVLRDFFNAYLFDERTGRLFASAHFTDMFNRWPWVQETIAAREGCEPDEVDCIETDDGDKITAKGVIVARMEILL